MPVIDTHCHPDDPAYAELAAAYRNRRRPGWRRPQRWGRRWHLIVTKGKSEEIVIIQEVSNHYGD